MSIIGGIDFGSLTDYLFFFANGKNGANWQGATKGFIGDVAVNGLVANEKTSGDVPYAGTINTNATALSAWQDIIDYNPTQSFASVNNTLLITALQNDLVNAIKQINLLPATSGFENVSATSLNNLNTQNGIDEVFVINITSDLNFSSKINITGDAGDVFILRWDTDANPANGYQGQLKPQSGGAIVPHGGLTPANFISVAGDINSSGGGNNPSAPYPQGPRYQNGTGNLIIGGDDWKGGGFFTGYLLTTGEPTVLDTTSGLYIGQTSSLSNGIFVGGWYSLTTKFSMTSGTSGVYVEPNPSTLPAPKIEIIKYVSPNNGVTWIDANDAPGPNISSNVTPQFKFVVTNTGNVTLTDIVVIDDVYDEIGTFSELKPNKHTEWIFPEAWSSGPHKNTATVTAKYLTQTVQDSDNAHYVGVAIENPVIKLVKYISINDGATWIEAHTAPGPTINSNVTPQFKFVVTNTGNVNLTDVVVTDNVYGEIGTLDVLQIGESEFFLHTGEWKEGEHQNIATVSAVFDEETLHDSSNAFYFGEQSHANPSIDIVKYVSVDDEKTWFNANTPPGPRLVNDSDLKFKYVVTNTGDTILTDIVVTDDVLGEIATLSQLKPGESKFWIV